MKGRYHRNCNHLYWAVGIVLLIQVMGCKDQDSDPPAVALSAPNQGFAVVADSEFTISGHATDDHGLASVTAILYESVTEVVVQTKTVPITGVKSTFSFRMPAGDRYTAAGDYTLRVTAKDAADNIGSAFIQISVQELPLQYLGMAWAGEGNGGNFSVFRRDTSGIIIPGPTGLAAMSDLLVDSRNRQILSVQSTGGVCTGWDLESFSQLFRIDLAQGTGTETYTGISMNRNAYYASVKVPDYMRSYRFDGSLKNNFETVAYPAYAILATDEKVYLGVGDAFGSVKKVDVYDASSDQLLATKVLDWEVKGILAVNESEILVYGNDNGLGRVKVLDRQSLVENQSLEFNEELVGATSGNGRVWLLSTTGLVEFFTSNGTVSSQLVSGSYTALGIDATRNQLFMGGQDLVEIRSGAGALLQQITGSFGTVKWIDTHYNR